ncbi:MAG: hypothetical protein CME06_12380 [Gemmatimonadetes bacterium]|nr:hypothetical protein [Gemmatimonadota bacterium]
MKRNIALLALALNLGAVATAAPLAFDAIVTGDWSAAGTWDGGELGHEYPIAGDDATVSFTTVRPGVLDQVDRLFLLSTGTVDVTGGDRLELLGSSSWTGGFLSGAGVIANFDSLTISSATGKYMRYSATLKNQGVVQMIAPAILTNHPSVRFENDPGAVFELVGAAAVSSAMAFVTDGTLLKSTGADTATVTVTAFEVSGSVGVENGGLSINSTTFDAVDGHFDLAAGTVLLLDTSTYTGTFSGSGTGNLELRSGNTYTLGTGGVVFDFPGDQLQWGGGTIQSDTLTNLGTLNLSSPDLKSLRYNAVLDNRDTVLVSGGGGMSNHSNVSFENAASALWEIQDGGTIAGGDFVNDGTLRKSTSNDTATVTMGTIEHSGVIEVSSGGLALNSTSFNSNDGDFDLAAGAVLLLDTSTYTGTFSGIGAGNLELRTGDTYTLGAGGVVFDFPGDQLQWSGGTIQSDTLTNLGTLNMSSPDLKYFRYGAVLDNRDTVLVSDGGGVSNHSNVRFENGPSSLFEIQDGGTIAGGTFVNGGTLRRSTSADTATLTLTRIENSAAIEVSSGGLQLNTTSFESIGGSFDVASGSVVRLDGTALGGTFTGSGDGVLELYTGQTYTPSDSGLVFDFPGEQLHWTGGTIQSDTVTNLGTMIIDSDAIKHLRYGAVLDNQGSVAIRDDGSMSNHSNIRIDNDSAAVFDFQGTATISGGTFTNDGLLSKSAGSGTATVAMATINTGTVEAASGTLSVSSTLTNAGGEILLRNAAFEYTAGTLDLADGSMRGSGTVIGDVVNSAGDVQPGLSAGQLTLVDDYEQEAGGTLSIEIGDPGPGTGHDLLEIGGTATLDGTLSVTIIDQFEPRPGDSFTVLECGARVDSLSTDLLPSLRGDWFWELSYSDTTLTLSVDGTGPVLGDIAPGLPNQVNSVTVAGAASGAPVGFAWGVVDGTTPIAPCPGESADMADPHVIGVVTANAMGEATVSSFVPSSASGLRVFVQAVDLSSCLVTNRVRYDFP